MKHGQKLLSCGFVSLSECVKVSLIKLNAILGTTLELFQALQILAINCGTIFFCDFFTLVEINYYVGFV